MNITRNTDPQGQADNTFNRHPGMETYEIIILLAFYSIACLAILVLNYLILRTFMTTKALPPFQRISIGYLATLDLAVGVVSIPSFLYNMVQWPCYTFFVYEAFDCLSGFASAFVITALSGQILRDTFSKVPKREVVHPTTRNLYLFLVGSAIVAGGLAALKVLSLMGFIPFLVFFYVAAGAMAAVVLVSFTTFIFILVAISCCKDRESAKDNQKKLRKLVLIASAINIFTWVLPNAVFTFNFFCDFCIPLPALFYYMFRFVLYAKSFLMPVGYFRSFPSLTKVLRKIITRDCLGRPFAK